MVLSKIKHIFSFKFNHSTKCRTTIDFMCFIMTTLNKLSSNTIDFRIHFYYITCLFICTIFKSFISLTFSLFLIITIY